MPKDILPIQFFEGGLNNSTNPRDIQDNELCETINVETNQKGFVKCLGEFESFFTVSATDLAGIPVNGGYGIQALQVDTKMTSTEGDVTAGYHLAVYKPHGSAPKIVFYQDPLDSGNGTDVGAYEPTTFNLPACDGSNSKVSFVYADGGLRIFDSEFAFKPQKMYYLPKNRVYFKGDDDNDLELTANKWECRTQFIEKPQGGKVIEVTGTTEPSNGDQTLTDQNQVGLLVLTHLASQGSHSSIPVGWGQDTSTANTVHFYASYVYDGNQESMATEIGNVSLGGNSGETGQSNAITIIPFVDPGQSAADWNLRRTGINIYYRMEQNSKEIIYLCGKFDTMKTDSTNCCFPLYGNSSGLLGESSGKTSNYGNWIDDYSDADIGNAGVYLKSAPTIFTHGVSSGIKHDTISTDCYYKTAALLNRRLYVGNIKQKTPESPSDAKEYPDRLLKSVTNRFDVLPDNSFIDVNVKDGENIIRLIGLGNRLFMFKESTLYVIMVAGAEEYLEATFPHMGIKHPNAVIKSDVGLFWVNEHGAFIYAEGKPSNLILNRIGNSEWANFITDDAVCGYDPKTKQYIVVGNSNDITGTGETDIANPDMYLWNITTNSWNKGLDKLGASTNAKCSNFSLYTDNDGNAHLLTLIHSADLFKWKNQEDATAQSKPFHLRTKEIDGGGPALRKKFYKVYITYRIGDITSKPAVKLHLSGPSHTGAITLEAIDDWAVNSTHFASASFKVADADLDKVKNVYAASVEVSGDTIHQSLEINDMSLIFRMKSVK